MSGNYFQDIIEKATGFNFAHPSTDADGNPKSDLQMAVAGVGGAVLIGATAHGLSKQFTGKGVVGNLRNTGEKSRRFFSGENEAPQEPKNSHSNNGDNATPNESTKHNNSPSINSRITNSNIKTPESKAWYQKITDAFTKTKTGKSVGVAIGTVE